MNTDELKVSLDDMKKLYRSKNEMDAMIKKITSYCPNLDVFVPRVPLSNETIAKAQKKVVEDFLESISWNTRIDNIYDTLESKGDSFYYMYFSNKSDKIPKLKYLEPKNMQRILLDDDGNPSVYKYVEVVNKTEIDNLGNINTLYSREITWLFSKGKTEIIDPIYHYDEKVKNWVQKLDEVSKKPIYDRKTVLNRPSYIDEIPIVRIPSFLREGQEFSDIPASFYSEHCLELDFLNSNIQQVLLMLGYPLILTVNGKVIGGERRPGGFINVTNRNDEPNSPEARVVDIQIKNGLEPFFTYMDGWEDSLREIVGLVPKSLQMKLGSSDSSRVVKQLTAPMENKIERYVNNIRNAMKLPIKVVLKENGLYDEERDNGITLAKPVFTIATSIFDQQIYEQNEINKKGKTIKELALERGDSYEEIESREDDLTSDEAEGTSNAESVDNVRSNNNL